MYSLISHRAAGHRVRAMIPWCWEVLEVFGFLLGGEGGVVELVIFDPHNFFGLFFDVWFDSPSGYRFLVLSDLFWASLRD